LPNGTVKTVFVLVFFIS